MGRGVLGALLATSLSSAQTTALTASWVIDGRGDTVIKNGVVVVEGERIQSVGAEGSAPADAMMIDLGDTTLLPGLIDLHSHPTLCCDDYQTTHLKKSSALKSLEALKSVRGQLEAGWTTIRTAGASDVYWGIVDVKRVIEQGLFVGPRMQVTGHYITVTGGGGDINFIAPDQRVIPDGLRVDGVEAMRLAVRKEVKYGGDWIKVLVTGAFMSAADDPRDVHMSPEELEAIVSEARRFKTPVMAHAHSADGIKMAIRAGARSIEHGTFLDDEGIRLMVEHGTYLVPTMYIGDYYLEEHPDSEAQQKSNELSKKYRGEFFANIGRAIDAGVKIGVGIDLGHFGHPPNVYARELRTLVEAGMTPIEAIQAATRVGAEALGWEDRLGTLEAGKLADIIAVAGNPLEDLGTLENVRFVMLGGKVVRDERGEP